MLQQVPASVGARVPLLQGSCTAGPDHAAATEHTHTHPRFTEKGGHPGQVGETDGHADGRRIASRSLLGTPINRRALPVAPCSSAACFQWAAKGSWQSLPFHSLAEQAWTARQPCGSSATCPPRQMWPPASAAAPSSWPGWPGALVSPPSSWRPPRGSRPASAAPSGSAAAAGCSPCSAPERSKGGESGDSLRGQRGQGTGV